MNVTTQVWEEELRLWGVINRVELCTVLITEGEYMKVNREFIKILLYQ